MAEYYDDGTTRAVTEVDQAHLNHGKRIEYWPNGNKKTQSTWKHGVISDSVFHYHENGQLARRSFYEDGVQIGRIIEYYPTGELYSRYYAENEKMTGRFESYFTTGSRKMDALTVMGEAKYYVEFDSLGHLLRHNLQPINTEIEDTISDGKVELIYADSFLMGYLTKNRIVYFLEFPNDAGDNYAGTIDGKIQQNNIVFEMPASMKRGPYYFMVETYVKNGDSTAASFILSKKVFMKK